MIWGLMLRKAATWKWIERGTGRQKVRIKPRKSKKSNKYRMFWNFWFTVHEADSIATEHLGNDQ